MAPLTRTAATLRLGGDDLEPDEISQLLGSAPTRAYRKGELRGSHRPVASRTGSWHLETETCEPGDLDAQIAKLLAPLTDDLAIWKNLTARYRADIFTGLFLTNYNEGLSLSPETLYAIGSRGLMLDLDIYAQDEND